MSANNKIFLSHLKYKTFISVARRKQYLQVSPVLKSDTSYILTDLYHKTGIQPQNVFFFSSKFVGDEGQEEKSPVLYNLLFKVNSNFALLSMS